ncbi:hypothetical protein [Streptomyces sp. NPDC007346]|uniref:hypothetical protein n=1 Tax=Streptomyces sp. NPDC007346 TaxID=3154682 RepID=UPI0034521B26
MNVGILSRIRDSAARLGAGVPYALKVLAGRLADDPDPGQGSSLPGVLTVTVDGDLFEDCPTLSIGHIRESDRMEIRYVNPVPSAQPAAPDHSEDQGRQQHRPVAEAGSVRKVAGAWRRITCWLRHNAPSRYDALRTGASPAALSCLEDSLGIRISVELSVLWLLAAGDDGGDGWGCLPGDRGLMNLDAVAAAYRLKREDQVSQDLLNVDRAGDGSVIGWGPRGFRCSLWARPAARRGSVWTPQPAAWGSGPGTTTPPARSATPWSSIGKRPSTCSIPQPWATQDKPGLAGGALVWLSSVGPVQEDRWRPWTGTT